VDVFEQYVRDVQAAYNLLNAPETALVFGFGGREREESSGPPAITWDEVDGEISGTVGSTGIPIASQGSMLPRVEVVVWYETRELARRACYLLMRAAQDVTVSGRASFYKYSINPAGSREYAARGFQFVLECKLTLPLDTTLLGDMNADPILDGAAYDVGVGSLEGILPSVALGDTDSILE